MQESDLDSFYSHHAASGSAVTLIFYDIMYKLRLFVFNFIFILIHLFIYYHCNRQQDIEEA